MSYTIYVSYRTPEISRVFNQKHQTISNIKYNHRWKTVTFDEITKKDIKYIKQLIESTPKPKGKYSFQLDLDLICYIKRLRKQGMMPVELMYKFGLGKRIIMSAINNYKYLNERVDKINEKVNKNIQLTLF